MNTVEDLISMIDRRGWAVMPDYLDPEGSRRLRDECESACEKGEFRPAGVGRGKDVKGHPPR